MRESTFTLVYWGFIPSFPTKGQLVVFQLFLDSVIVVVAVVEVVVVVVVVGVAFAADYFYFGYIYIYIFRICFHPSTSWGLLQNLPILKVVLLSTAQKIPSLKLT